MARPLQDFQTWNQSSLQQPNLVGQVLDNRLHSIIHARNNGEYSDCSIPLPPAPTSSPSASQLEAMPYPPLQRPSSHFDELYDVTPSRRAPQGGLTQRPSSKESGFYDQASHQPIYTERLPSDTFVFHDIASPLPAIQDAYAERPPLHLQPSHTLTSPIPAIQDAHAKRPPLHPKSKQSLTSPLLAIQDARTERPHKRAKPSHKPTPRFLAIQDARAERPFERLRSDRLSPQLSYPQTNQQTHSSLNSHGDVYSGHKHLRSRLSDIEYSSLAPTERTLKEPVVKMEKRSGLLRSRAGRDEDSRSVTSKGFTLKGEKGLGLATSGHSNKVTHPEWEKELLDAPSWEAISRVLLKTTHIEETVRAHPTVLELIVAKAREYREAEDGHS